MTDLAAEIDRARRELAHWVALSDKHPDWANPKMQARLAREYLAYLKTQ